jgi:type II secretory pathway pseudopilin PulG
MGQDGMKVPSVGFVLMLKVKDSTLYDMITAALKQQGAKLEPEPEDSKLKAVAIQVPENPFKLKPVLAQAGDWFFVASERAELTRALASSEQGKGLCDSEEYKMLSEDLPTEINEILFVSPRLNKHIADVIDQMPFLSGRGAIAKQLAGMKEDAKGRVGIRVNDDEGMLWITQGDVSGGDLAAALVAAPAAVAAAVAVPNFLEAQQRSKVARTKSDMRSMATALEAYFVDNNTYPSWTDKPGEGVMRAKANGKEVPGFAGPSLTTPIAYLTRHMHDVYAPKGKKQTFGYYAPKVNDKSGWILWSPGPDMKFDLDWKVYDPSVSQPSPDLLRYVYDPTNGTVSKGDIFRVRQ